MIAKLNLRHLEAISLTHSFGSTLAASIQLNLSQSAVSQGISMIEKALDCALFIRRKTGMFLTPEGDIYLKRLQPALKALEISLKRRVKKDVNPLRLVTTSQLRALVAVERHGNFAKAAEAEGLSQPSVHRSARDLEKTIEEALFERTSFGLRPTKSAQELAREVRLFFYELEQARADLAHYHGQVSGSCTIGAMPLARSHLVPATVSAFMEEYPSFKVSIVGAPYDDLLAGLRDGRIDFLLGALRDHVPSDITQELLFDDPLSILMRPDHPLTVKDSLGQEDFQRYPWVIPHPESPLSNHFESLFADGLLPTNTIETNALSVARVLLRNSDRLMLLSDAQARYELESGQLTSRRIKGSHIRRPIGLTIRREWKPTELQQHLVDRIRMNSKPLATG